MQLAKHNDYRSLLKAVMVVIIRSLDYAVSANHYTTCYNCTSITVWSYVSLIQPNMAGARFLWSIFWCVWWIDSKHSSLNRETSTYNSISWVKFPSRKTWWGKCVKLLLLINLKKNHEKDDILSFYYDFCIKRCSVSSLPPVVCRRVHVLFTLFVFACT
jgi:hypothetical protein